MNLRNNQKVNDKVVFIRLQEPHGPFKQNTNIIIMSELSILTGKPASYGWGICPAVGWYRLTN